MEAAAAVPPPNHESHMETAHGNCDARPASAAVVIAVASPFRCCSGGLLYLSIQGPSAPCVADSSTIRQRSPLCALL
jgi:hypothetical protein